MKVMQSIGSKRFIAESPEEIKLVCGSYTVSLKELILRITKYGMRPDYNGVIYADLNDSTIIVNEVKNKNEQFDILLKSADCKLPFEKVASCFVSASYLINDPPYHEFHSNGGTE
jgi:hypothetical protein